VRDHVRAFGGTIRVVESPDGGARFQILLPSHEETLE
jgi:signal transduction histidine kinase